MTLSVDINRNPLPRNTSNRNVRGESATRTRKLVAAIGMVAPLTAFLAAAAWYLTI